jgi:nucleoid DNA-binding protein
MNKNCKAANWFVKFKAKKKPRFKAGSELSDKVNKMNVDIQEEESEISKAIDMKMEVEQSENDHLEIALKKKLRFKAGADLTEKVNLVSVESSENFDEDSSESELKLKLEENESETLDISCKKKIKFKAGAELTDKVNKLNFDLDENSDENSADTMLKMEIETMEKQRLAIALKKKIKFKAGADLTDKVNLVAVDWIEEMTDDQEIVTVTMKISSAICQTQISEKAEILD